MKGFRFCLDFKTSLNEYLTNSDRQIDALVYELYRLTKEEQKIVEGAS